MGYLIDSLGPRHHLQHERVAVSFNAWAGSRAIAGTEAVGAPVGAAT